MHRIDTSGNVNGQFDPGNPASGQQATLIGADWLNTVQEELISVIAGANIDLDKADNGQLAAAITALIAGVVGDGSGAVPTTRQVLTSGPLLTGGGTLAADRTIGLTAATPAEVAAQTASDKVVTPQGLAGLVGWTTLGGGLVGTLGNGIIQAFSATAQSETNTVVTLPQAFPTSCRAAVCSGGSQGGSQSENNPFVSGLGASSISIFSRRDSAVPVSIIAIGT